MAGLLANCYTLLYFFYCACILRNNSACKILKFWFKTVCNILWGGFLKFDLLLCVFFIYSKNIQLLNVNYSSLRTPLEYVRDKAVKKRKCHLWFSKIFLNFQLNMRVQLVCCKLIFILIAAYEILRSRPTKVVIRHWTQHTSNDPSVTLTQFCEPAILQSWWNTPMTPPWQL